MAMTQHAADFGQRRSVPEHIGGQCMPELVGAVVVCIDAGTPDCGTDNRGNGCR